MRMYDLIEKKKHNIPLSKDEIEYWVKGFTDGSIPDYQTSSMAMAIYFNGMTEEETLYLTTAMAYSGDMLDLSNIPGIKVDKHSTGGVGDKTTISLIPMVASCGLKVAKMSGRGLGHTGGTIDKFESFPGFSTEISTDDFEKNVNEINVSIMGQTKDLAPADKKLYALRDVTATVDSIPLIASSVMSKKLAAGADAIVLDVTTGSGAFMKTVENARALSKEMVSLGKNAGRKTIAVISNMDEPLGFAVGNALEVKEAIDTLNGNGPEDFKELVFTLGSYMLVAGKIASTKEEALDMLEKSISSGAALNKMAELVKAQGGDPDYVYHPEKLCKATYVSEVLSTKSGFVSRIECDEIGLCSMSLGGGRETKESIIDLSVGIVLNKKVGDYVDTGDVIATIHANDSDKISVIANRVLNAYSIVNDKVEKNPVIIDVIE